jgi:glycosyltransferase involved in cell wall biosynthesis
MNVVMIGPFAFKPKGTISVRAFFIARALVKRGHRVTILMPPYDNLAESGRAWEEEGVCLENATLVRNDAWHQLSVPLRLARRTMQLDADVVHVFKPIGYSGLTGLYLRLLSRRPLVLDTDDWEGRGGWSDVNPYPALWKVLFGWQERWLARQANVVTVASHTLQAQVWGFGVHSERVVYLPNGPDARLRSQPEPNRAQQGALRGKLGLKEAPFALYLGHIPHGNDLDLALEALAIVGDQLPEARLMIAGVGDGLPALEAQARQLGVSSRVLFPGWVEPEEAPIYLAAADAVINPYRDTLINRAKCAGKVVAAMAVGKAVITSRVGENLAYIEDGQSGLLTEPGDPRSLAQALLAVLSHPEWAAKLGCNARARIWEKYDWDTRIGQVEEAYRMARDQRSMDV